MRHSRLTEDDSRKRVAKIAVTRMLLYSLYQKKCGRWLRVSDVAYNQALAYRVFITRLLTQPEIYSIRPIQIELPKAQGVSHFGGKILIH